MSHAPRNAFPGPGGRAASRRFRRGAAVALVALAFPLVAQAGTGKVRMSGPTRLLDFCVSIRFDADAGQLANIQRAFTDASAVLADATDGQYAFGNVDLVNGSNGSREAEVWVLPSSGRAYATCGLFGTPGEHITLYYPSNLVENPVAEADAYTVAHEFMHHVWGVKDEYVGPAGPAECEPEPGSPTASFCLMDNYFVRGGNDAMGTGTYTLNELCVASNHDPDLDTFEEFVWMQSCWERLASHPTRSLVAPADLPDDPAPAVAAPTFRFPATNRRFVLCLDRSSDESAQGNVRLTYEKQAAKIFIDLIPAGDELAVTSFAGTATTDFPLTEIQTDADRTAAKAAVTALVAGGPTAIGAGITRARNVLTGQAQIACAQSIILLTDGLGNTGVSELSLIPSLIANDISVISIAVGTSVSVGNLQQIVTATGGRLLVLGGPPDFAPLVSALTAEVLGGGVADEIAGSVAQGQTVVEPVTIDSLIEQATIALIWPDLDDDLDLTLTTPAGSTITPADAVSSPDIDFISDDGSEIFIITGDTLEEGDWSASVAGISVDIDGSFCLATLVGNDDAVMVGAPDQPNYDLTETITVLATPRFNGNAVTGAAVTGTFTRPDGTTGSLSLFDDGNSANGDDFADDGVYSTLFGAFNGVTGAYAFNLRVENANGTTFGGESLYATVGAPIFTESAPPFVRRATTTAVVAGANSFPIISCAGIVNAECAQAGNTEVTVEATVFDVDGDALEVTWQVGGNTVQVDQVPAGGPPTLAILSLVWSFEEGVHVVSTIVDDGQGPIQCSSSVTVADGTGPELGVTLDRTVLWPPNHTLVDITALVETSDGCDAEPTFELTSIRSDEPGEADDIFGVEYGTPDTEFQLRSERLGNGDGREYTITYTAFDAVGNSTEHVSIVFVPHDFSVGTVFGDAGSFTADGTDLRPEATTYLLVVREDATAPIDPATASVGNPLGSIRPLGFVREDVDGDGVIDLVLRFPADKTRSLRQISGSLHPLSLHTLTTSNTFYWTEDIFALGPPLVVNLTTDAPGIGETPEALVRLYRPVPNPFREHSRLAYAVGGSGGRVNVTVYDVAGRRVRELVDEVEAPGVHEVAWDGRSSSGERVPSGVYFFRLVVAGEERTVRVTLLR